MIPKNMALGASQIFLLTACLLLFGQCCEHQETASEMETSKHKAAGAHSGIHFRGHPEYTQTVSHSRWGHDSKTATYRTKYSSATVGFQFFFLVAKGINFVFIINTSPLIMRYLHETEPDAVKARRRRRFKRRRFFAAGVNDIWAMDQHDKWGPRFGLWLHNGIDPFMSINNWLKVWWTNKNPRLIAKYFLDHVRNYGGRVLY